MKERLTSWTQVSGGLSPVGGFKRGWNEAEMVQFLVRGVGFVMVLLLLQEASSKPDVVVLAAAAVSCLMSV